MASSIARSTTSPAGDDLVDEADLERLGRAQRAALEAEPKRRPRSDEVDEALGAAAAGREAEQDLGLADPVLVALGRDPEVAGERELAAAAHRRAVDRGDDDRAGGVQAQQRVAEVLRLREAGDRGPVERGGRRPAPCARAPTARSEPWIVRAPMLGDAFAAASSSPTS